MAILRRLCLADKTVEEKKNKSLGKGLEGPWSKRLINDDGSMIREGKELLRPGGSHSSPPGQGNTSPVPRMEQN